MCNQYNGASPKEARLVTLQDLRESLDLEASCASEPEYDGGESMIQEKPATQKVWTQEREALRRLA